MPGLALAMKEDRESVVAHAKAERRRFMRVPVDLAGRLFVPGDGREATCKVVDLSPGGAQLASEFVPAADTNIILYIDGFGRFEGIVTRPDETSFGVRFNCSALKRERVAEQLTLYMNRGEVDESLLRRHDRTPTKGFARFTRANGDILACEVVDLSLSGVSLKTDARPPLGEVVLIGQMAGKVVRHHEAGIAIEFVGPPVEKANQDRQSLTVVR
jgi:hypothetical protein